MKSNLGSLSLLFLGLAVWNGCSSKAGKESQKALAVPDKVQGKALVFTESITDAALNAGGPSVYLVDGLSRYRLFFNTAVEVTNGKEYVAEGIYAQKAIDDIGDPDKGKNGYPLQDSCEKVVHKAWSNLALDIAAGHVEALCAVIKRHPARPVFLVMKIEPAAAKAGGESAESKKEEGEEKGPPEVSVPWEKERAAMIEGPTVLPAPLWEPAGKTVSCKLIIDQTGKVSELETGMQLCESVPWPRFRFQPPVQRGKPVKVKTEVEVRFEPRT